MRSVITLVFFTLIGVGCVQSKYRSAEGQYCSVDEDEDPHYSCLKSYDLVCINTYAIPKLVDGGEATGSQDVYLCRLACTPGESCPASGDVCCPGKIHGTNYGKSHACVPATQCETGTPAPSGDAGSKDAQLRVDGGATDGASDRAADLGGAADAPATSDAPEADGPSGG